MSIQNNNCDGFKLALSSCYRIMHSLRSNPEFYQDNICDGTFNHYILCLKVICFLFIRIIL